MTFTFDLGQGAVTAVLFIGVYAVAIAAIVSTPRRPRQ